MDDVAELQSEVERLKKRPPKKSERAYEAKIANLMSETNQLRKELKEVGRVEDLKRSLVAELEALVTPITPLPSEKPRKSGKKRIEEHLVLHLSDEHADAVVEPYQVGGLETYNFSVALCRAERLVDTVIQWTQETLSNHRFPVLHIFKYGDHTNGEIHNAVHHSEYRNILKSCLAIGQMHSLMIRDLAPYFDEIKVYCVPGNHGRRSKKKDFHGAHNSWDYLISEIAKLECKSLENVEFMIPNCYSINVNVNGFGFNIQHGDGIKGWNGIPFYGIERKTRRLVALNHAVGDTRIDYFVLGHFHTATISADLKGETIINGAWPATDPYSFEEFCGYREPIQQFHGVHAKWGVSWRMPIKLKDTAREAEGPQRYKVLLADETQTQL